MATLRFVDPAHAEIIRDYLGSDDGGAVVLILPEVQDKVRAMGLDDGDGVDHDFGGQADVSVELVGSPTHYFFPSTDEDDA